jgi:hypothetical protein
MDKANRFLTDTIFPTSVRGYVDDLILNFFENLQNIKNQSAPPGGNELYGT